MPAPAAPSADQIYSYLGRSSPVGLTSGMFVSIESVPVSQEMYNNLSELRLYKVVNGVDVLFARCLIPPSIITPIPGSNYKDLGRIIFNTYIDVREKNDLIGTLYKRHIQIAVAINEFAPIVDGVLPLTTIRGGFYSDIITEVSSEFNYHSNSGICLCTQGYDGISEYSAIYDGEVYGPLKVVGGYVQNTDPDYIGDVIIFRKRTLYPPINYFNIDESSSKYDAVPVARPGTVVSAYPSVPNVTHYTVRDDSIENNIGEFVSIYATPSDTKTYIPVGERVVWRTTSPINGEMGIKYSIEAIKKYI